MSSALFIVLWLAGYYAIGFYTSSVFLRALSGSLFMLPLWLLRKMRESKYRAKHGHMAVGGEELEEEFHRSRLWDGYMSAAELVEHLKKRTAGDPDLRSLCIVDVREHDFTRFGFKIMAARNEPAKRLLKDVGALVRALRDKELVVFHCMFSQYRGPKCAQEYVRHRQQIPQLPEQKVLVLEGGIAEFYRTYKPSSQQAILFEEI